MRNKTIWDDVSISAIQKYMSCAHITSIFGQDYLPDILDYVTKIRLDL